MGAAVASLYCVPLFKLILQGRQGMSTLDNGPTIRPFQFDGGTSGMLKKSVNLYRGQVTIPLPLVTLSGRNGLSVALTALYQGVTAAEATTWNMASPTGVLGLGWDLPLEQILAVPSGTAAAAGMTYVLASQGNRTRLLNTGTPNEFIAEDYELWTITHNPSDNSWTVRHDDGNTYYYGGPAQEGNAYVETGVTWQEWLGSSVQQDASTYPIAWNLRSISNGWGDRVSFAYDYDEVPIGAGGPTFTRSSRLRTVTDVFGRVVSLTYADKIVDSQAREIQPPHIDPNGRRVEAYQDHYQTKYLVSIDVPDFSGQPFFRVVVATSLRNFGNQSDPYLYKRCVDAIYTHYVGADPEPGLRFTYNPAGSIAPGSLASTSTPLGSTLQYEYGEVALENAPTILTLEPGQGEPRVWFGPDYVVRTFQDGNTLRIEILNWSGGWSRVPVASLNASGKVEDLRLIAQETYFILYYQGHTVPGPLNASVFVRNPFLPDSWSRYDLTETVERVAAGPQYFATHPVDSSQLRTYRVAETTVYPESTVTLRSKNVAIAGSGDFFLAFACDKTNHTGSAGLISRDASGTWVQRTVQLLSDVFWDEWVRDSFWGPGVGFAAATYLSQDQKTYRICVLQWAPSITAPTWQELGSYPVPTSGQLPFAVSRAVGSLVGNDEHLFRFDGQTWIPGNLPAPPGGSEGQETARFVYGDDAAIESSLSAGQSNYTLVTYDAYGSRWNGRSLGSGGKGAGAPYPATLGTDYLTVENALHFRGAGSGWLPVSGARLGDAINFNSVKNLGPTFVLSENTAGTDTFLVVLKNGSYIPAGPQPYLRLSGQRCYVPGDNAEAPGTALAGPGSFITYSGEFAPGVSMTLYRVLDTQIDTRQMQATVQVVRSLTLIESETPQVSRYDYNEFSAGHSSAPIARGATFDPSGRFAEFSKVIVSQGDSERCGTSVKYFLNGVAPEERTVFYPPNDPYSNARTYATLMNGVLVGELALNSRGQVASLSLTSWQAYLLKVQSSLATYVRQRRLVQASNCVALTTIDASVGNTRTLDEGKVPTPLAEALAAAGMALGASPDVVVYEIGQLWLLLDDSSDRAFPIANNTVTSTLDIRASVRSTTLLEYDPSTSLPRRKTTRNVTSTGEQRDHTLETRYLSDVLPELADTHSLLSQVVQTTSSVSVNGQPPLYTSSQVNLMWTWLCDERSQLATPTSGLDPNLPVASWQTFLWTTPGASSGDSPVFDAWKTGTPDPKLWRRQLTVSQRTPRGQELEKLSLDGVPAAYVWDTSEIQPIARFANASVSAGEASYYAFEPNELNPGWTLAGAAPPVYAGDSHTGSRCCKVSAAQQPLSLTAMPARPQSYFFSCWVKTPAGGAGGAAWTFTRKSDGRPCAAALAVPDTHGQWSKLYRLIDLSQESPATAVAIELSGISGGVVLVDNLRFSPLQAAFTASALDARYACVTATLDSNAETAYVLSDYANRSIGSVGPGNCGGWQSNFLWTASHSSYDAARPNSTLTAQARSWARYGRFMPDNWQDTWRCETPASWSVADGALTLLVDRTSTLSLRESLPSGAFALRVQVTTPEKILAPISIRLMDGEGSAQTADITLAPGGDRGEWTLYQGSTPLQGPVPNLRSGAAEWCVIISGHSVLFLVAGELVFSAALAFIPGGTVEYRASQAGISLSELLVSADPVVTMQFQDGGGQTRQVQQLDGELANIKQTLYDELGRATITTKTAPVPASAHPLLSYRPEFAIFDPESGTLRGDVAVYYSSANPDAPSDDQGYPFSRTVFEDSPVGRVIEQSSPGAAHAIGSGHSTSFEYQPNIEVSLNGALGFPIGQFAVAWAIDADGTRSFQVQDKLGQVIAAATVTAAEFNLSSWSFDLAGNQIESRTPAYFRPPSGQDPNRFITRNRYDSLHAILESTSDLLTTQYIRDPAGRVRFMQDERGRAEGYYCYWTYDEVRRNIESGFVSGAWNTTTLEEYAANLPLLTGEPDWPTAAVPEVTCSKRLRYDGDGSLPCQLGLLGHSEVAATAGADLAVHESFVYDPTGRVVSTRVEWPGSGLDAESLHFSYDAAGNLLSENDGVLLDVTYSYDRANRISTVGNSKDPRRYASYDYYASGLIRTERLNQESLRIPRRYNSGWQLLQLGDQGSPFQESLWFEVRKEGTPGYFDGRIASTETALHWSGAPTGFSNEYTYDGLKQLVTSDCSIGAWSMGADTPIAYDNNGNLVTVQTAQGTETYTSVGNVLQTLQVPGQAANVFQYDANQSVVKVSGRDLTLTYDRCSLLTLTAQRSDGTQAAYAYNLTQSRSVEATESGGSQTRRFFVYGADATPRVEIVIDATGTRRIAYVRGPTGLIAMEADTTCFVLCDHLGSSRAVLDSHNSVIAGYDYLPFGALARSYGTQPDILAFRFTGQRWDPATGLYYYGARMYDPAVRRFYARDPGLQFPSPYLYVGNNPLSWIDPSGAFGWQNMVGALVGGLEVLAGVVLDVVLDISTAGLAAAADIGIGGLIGAGAQALSYSLTAGDEFQWSQFAVNEGIGATIGVMTAGFGAFAAWAGESVTSAAEAAAWSARSVANAGKFTEAGINVVVGGGVSGVLGQTYSDLVGGQTPGADLAFAFGFGVIGGAIGLASVKLNQVADRMPIAGRGVPAADRPRTGAWVLCRALLGGTLSAGVNYVIQGCANVAQSEDWNSGWASTVALGFTLGMVPSIPKKSAWRYERLIDETNSSIELH